MCRCEAYRSDEVRQQSVNLSCLNIDKSHSGGNISRSGWYSPVVVGLTGNIKASHQEQSADGQQIDVCITAFQRCTEHVTHVEQMESLCLCVKGKGKEVYFTNKKIYKHSGGPGP